MPASSRAPLVSVVIVSHNTREELLRCLDSLARHGGLPLEVVVVDNQSSDGSPAAVRGAFPHARVLEMGENAGFARANNSGLRQSHGPYVLFLNSDTEVAPDCLPALVRVLEGHPKAGVVGPRTLNSDGSIQVSSGPRPTLLSEWSQRRLVLGVRHRAPWALTAAGTRYAREHEPAWVSASCLLARREALLAVGGFDEAFFLYQEDADLCLRVRRAGWRIVFTPEAQVIHHLGRSMARAGARPRIEYHRSHLLFYRKHNGPLPTLALRFYLLVRAGWTLAQGAGPEARQIALIALPGGLDRP